MAVFETDILKVTLVVSIDHIISFPCTVIACSIHFKLSSFSRLLIKLTQCYWEVRIIQCTLVERVMVYIEIIC